MNEEAPMMYFHGITSQVSMARLSEWIERKDRLQRQTEDYGGKLEVGEIKWKDKEGECSMVAWFPDQKSLAKFEREVLHLNRPAGP